MKKSADNFLSNNMVLEEMYMLVAQQENWYMKGKYSKYSKIIRTMMWILCFINNCQALRSTESTELIIKKNTVLEFMVLKWTLSQQESFNGVNEPRLSTLYEDENGLLRLKSSLIESLIEKIRMISTVPS